MDKCPSLNIITNEIPVSLHHMNEDIETKYTAYEYKHMAV